MPLPGWPQQSAATVSRPTNGKTAAVMGRTTPSSSNAKRRTVKGRIAKDRTVKPCEDIFTFMAKRKLRWQKILQEGLARKLAERGEEEGKPELNAFLSEWKEKLVKEKGIIHGNIAIQINKLKETERLLADQKTKLEEERAKLQANEKKRMQQAEILQRIGGSDKAIPECPVCWDLMTSEIYSCKNGHGICGTCKRKVTRCTICRCSSYIYRNIIMEQTVRIIQENNKKIV